MKEGSIIRKKSKRSPTAIAEDQEEPNDVGTVDDDEESKGVAPAIAEDQEEPKVVGTVDDDEPRRKSFCLMRASVRRITRGVGSKNCTVAFVPTTKWRRTKTSLALLTLTKLVSLFLGVRVKSFRLRNLKS